MITRVDLLVPEPQGLVQRGLLRALEAAVGDVLVEPPVTERFEESRMRRYRLEVSEESTIEVPLGSWGSAGVGLEEGRICLDAPAVAAAVLRTAAGRAVHAVRPLPQGRRRTILNLQPGGAVRVPLGTRGKLVVRLAPL